MQINNHKISFGDIIINPKSKKLYDTRFSKEDTEKLKRYIEQQKGKRPHILLTHNDTSDSNQLYAVINSKRFCQPYEYKPDSIPVIKDPSDFRFIERAVGFVKEYQRIIGNKKDITVDEANTAEIIVKLNQLI